MEKNILIIYSREDQSRADRLDTHLQPLIQAGLDLRISHWNDSGLEDDWYPQLDDILNHTDVIILAVSNGFLNSALMQSRELKERLKRKQRGRTPMFLLLIEKCSWRRYPWMKAVTVFPRGGRLLVDMGKSEVDGVLAGVAEAIADEYRLKPMSEGILAYLQLNNVGPVREMAFEPGSRLNIITGDNGLGKTFLMECAWWALSGLWAGNLVYPRDSVDRDNTCIRFQLAAKSGNRGNVETIHYDWDRLTWPVNEVCDNTGLVVYARVDGSFAVWDPVRGKVPPPIGAREKGSPLLFSTTQIYTGIEEKIPGKSDRLLCNGMFADWLTWQRTPGSPFELFAAVLERLSSHPHVSTHMGGGPLEPGEPVTVPGDTREIPSLKYPYGNVPIIHAASSVKRIVSLAYLILWTWEMHKAVCKKTEKIPYEHMVILIDEIESHLHPQWQRSIVSAMLELKNFLGNELDIQFVISTHSPLILASVEPMFDLDKDKLFHMDMERREVRLEPQEFTRRGRVDNWYTSNTFELGQARSLEAENAIAEARALQKQTEPEPIDVNKIHYRLVHLLGAYDTFWPRWLYWAEKHGVNDDPGSETT
ncbi:MAG: AAA family ATPase [bacterium]|nr:AAA family ATPase [bacterium]